MSGLPGLRPRLSLLVGFFALLLAGCASSGSDALVSRAPFPDYAAAEPVRGMERSTLCHQDSRTITIVNIAVEAHLRHGDYFGACSADGRARQEAYYRERASADGS